MSDEKWSLMPVADPLTGTEVTCVAQDGESRQTTPNGYVTLASGVIVPAAVAAAATYTDTQVAAAVATSEAYTDSKFPVPNTQLANMVEATVKGRAAGAGTGVPQDLTQAQLTELVNLFTDALPGAVPAPISVDGNFLSDDGTWQPAGGGGGFETGSFTGTVTGFGADDTPIAMGYVAFPYFLNPVFPRMVILWAMETVSGAGNGSNFRLEGLPAAIQANGGSVSIPTCFLYTNTGPQALYNGLAQVDSSHVAFYLNAVDGGFFIKADSVVANLSSGTLGLPGGWTIAYPASIGG